MTAADDLNVLLAEVDAILPRLLRPATTPGFPARPPLIVEAAHLIDRLGSALAVYRDAELVADAVDPFARMHSEMALRSQAARDAVELRARHTEDDLERAADDEAVSAWLGGADYRSPEVRP